MKHFRAKGSRKRFDARLIDLGEILIRRTRHKNAQQSHTKKLLDKSKKKMNLDPSLLAWIGKTDYKAYLETRHWNKKRHEAIKFHEGKCSECGMDRYLQVHHLNYDSLGNEAMSDLLVLCRDCHSLLHEKDGVIAMDVLSVEFREMFS